MDRNQAIGLVVGPCIAISVTLKYYKCALFILDQLRKLIGKIIIHKPVRLSRPDIIPVQIDVSHVLSGENHVPVINHIKSIYSLKPIGENLFKDFPALCIDNSEIQIIPAFIDQSKISFIQPPHLGIEFIHRQKWISCSPTKNL